MRGELSVESLSSWREDPYRMAILNAVAEGKTQKNVARFVGVSVRRVEKALRAMFEETGAPNTVNLIRRACVAGLLDAVTEGEPVEVNVRQMQVVRWLGEGLTQEKAAKAIGIAKVTVIRHVRMLLKEFGASNAVQLVFLAQRQVSKGIPLAVLSCFGCEARKEAPWGACPVWIREQGWTFSRIHQPWCPQCSALPKRYRKRPVGGSG